MLVTINCAHAVMTEETSDESDFKLLTSYFLLKYESSYFKIKELLWPSGYEL